MENLDHWRNKIDFLNDKILDLINDRIKCAQAIAHIKKAENKKIHDPEREEKILEKLKIENKGPLSEASLIRIFKTIMEETRDFENRQIN